MCRLLNCSIATARGICIVEALWECPAPGRGGTWQVRKAATNEMALRQGARAYLEGEGLDFASTGRYPCPAGIAARAKFDPPSPTEIAW